MIQVEKIKAEIKRRMLEDYNSSDAQKDEIAQGVCAGILTFINSLHQEEVNEELKAEVQRWREHYIAVKEHGFQINLRDIETVAYHFAQWQKEKMLKALLDMEKDSVEVERKYGEGGRELYLKMLGILRTFEED